MEQGEKKNLSYGELERVFRNAGLKITNQRIAVYREVVERCSHPAVEEVYERVRAGLPAISLNTVYRILTSFVEKGLLRRVDNPACRGLYDDNLEEHHHFVCRQCGAVHDVYIENVNVLDISGGFIDEIGDIAIRVSGLCGACGKSDFAAEFLS